MKERCVDTACDLITRLIEELRYFRAQHPDNERWLEEMNRLDRLSLYVRTQYEALKARGL